MSTIDSDWHVISPKVANEMLWTCRYEQSVKEIITNYRRPQKDFNFSVFLGCEVIVFMNLNLRTVMCLTQRRKLKQQLQMDLSTNWLKLNSEPWNLTDVSCSSTQISLKPVAAWYLPWKRNTLRAIFLAWWEPHFSIERNILIKQLSYSRYAEYSL